MSTKLLRLLKGKEIELEGTKYKIARSGNVNVIKPKEAAKEEEVKGNHRTDEQPQRVKKALCTILQKKIEALEKEEYNALFDIEEDDPLFLSERSEGYDKITISEQLGRVQAIGHLKDSLKEIQAI
jgi:hypothetical protein